MRKIVSRIRSRLYEGPSGAPPHPAGTLRVISWNLLHSSGALVEDIAALIEHEDPDIFLMQEATGMLDALPRLTGGKIYQQEWPGRRHGLAAWSKVPPETIGPLRLPRSRMPGSFPGRFAQVLGVAGINIVNVHLSHGQILNRRQLRQIAQSTEGPAAIIGDYNTLGPTILKGFLDVGPSGHTHHAQDLVPFRLDRCMVRDLECISAESLHKGPSDHRPIMLDFNLPGVQEAGDTPENRKAGTRAQFSQADPHQ